MIEDNLKVKLHVFKYLIAEFWYSALFHSILIKKEVRVDDVDAEKTESKGEDSP